MDTPICDFVRNYAQTDALRLHMPGHKGNAFLGMESLDITEIDGADSLYEADGIIARSEANASRLFGCKTLYSAEGSSQCIRAMLYLVQMHARQTGKPLRIAAGRNAHKTFLTAAALLDLDVDWLYPRENTGYLSCALSPEDVAGYLETAEEIPAAVYLTNPDYLGNLLDLAAMAAVVHRYGTLLVVDNAHGAYLKFLTDSHHPMDLGADLCCDSAHKTLPVLTGGAYLHISGRFPEELAYQAKNAMALFGSTSPSYLILQSLDAANVYLETYGEKLAAYLPKAEALKKELSLQGDEPLKLTIQTKSLGYTGTEYAALLETRNIICEFADPDFVVLMLTPEIDLEPIRTALLSTPSKEPVQKNPPVFHRPEQVMTIRQATFSPCETIPVSGSMGRILASPSVGCPPAVPIVVCGERIDREAVACFQYYGIDQCTVLL